MNKEQIGGSMDNPQEMLEADFSNTVCHSTVFPFLIEIKELDTEIITGLHAFNLSPIHFV